MMEEELQVTPYINYKERLGEAQLPYERSKSRQGPICYGKEKKAYRGENIRQHFFNKAIRMALVSRYSHYVL